MFQSNPPQNAVYGMHILPQNAIVCFNKQNAICGVIFRRSSPIAHWSERSNMMIRAAANETYQMRDHITSPGHRPRPKTNTFLGQSMYGSRASAQMVSIPTGSEYVDSWITTTFDTYMAFVLDYSYPAALSVLSMMLSDYTSGPLTHHIRVWLKRNNDAVGLWLSTENLIRRFESPRRTENPHHEADEPDRSKAENDGAFENAVRFETVQIIRQVVDEIQETGVPHLASLVNVNSAAAALYKTATEEDSEDDASSCVTIKVGRVAWQNFLRVMRPEQKDDEDGSGDQDLQDIAIDDTKASDRAPKAPERDSNSPANEVLGIE